MWNWISGNLIKTLTSALSAASPDIKAWLKEALDVLEVKAAATPNKYDDILVSILRSVLGM